MRFQTAAMPATTIAVLPLENLSSEPENEHFRDGFTEETIDVLAQIDGLKVTSEISTFHCKGRNIPKSEIDGKHRVDTLPQGSVRFTENTIGVTARLIDPAEDFNFRSETLNWKPDNMNRI